ncbi:MAG: hypothetical protein M3355_11850 [Actinomycetota bacterium]|nr:hypothetical protein [Actinomycetota bacterium]
MSTLALILTVAALWLVLGFLLGTVIGKAAKLNRRPGYIEVTPGRERLGLDEDGR